MAIKISNNTIIDDSRNIVNAGIATANFFDGFVPGGDKVYNDSTTINNNKVNVALESDIVVGSGKTLTVSTGSTIILNPFDFENSSVEELLIDKKLIVGVSSSFDVVTSGVGSVGVSSTRLVGSGINTTNNVSLGLLVKPIPGIIGAGTTITGIGGTTGSGIITISPASLNTTVQENITFKFGAYGENKSAIILDGETGLIKSGSNTVLIDGKNDKITINNTTLDATTDTLVITKNDEEKIRILENGGITFNGDTAAVNALDDYEEGTWTPVIPGTSITYGAQQGVYTKIGNVVYIRFYVVLTGGTPTGGSAGSACVTGLPFTSEATQYWPLVTTANGGNFGGTVPVGQVPPSSAIISALAITNNAAYVDSTPTSVWDANNNWLQCAGFYRVA